MRKTTELSALVPEIVGELECRDHEIGSIYPVQDEDGYCDVEDSVTNEFEFEKDGWSVGVTYEAVGRWRAESGDRWTPAGISLESAWGELTCLEAVYTDEQDCEHIAGDEELAPLRKAVEEILKDIA